MHVSRISPGNIEIVSRQRIGSVESCMDCSFCVVAKPFERHAAAQGSCIMAREDAIVVDIVYHSAERIGAVENTVGTSDDFDPFEA